MLSSITLYVSILLPVNANSASDQGHTNQFANAFHLKPMQDFPGDTPIEEIHSNDSILQSPLEFYKRYTGSNRPVIIRNLAGDVLSGLENGYEKLKKEGPDVFFRKLFLDGGETYIEAETLKIEVRGGPSEVMTFKQFVKEIDDENRANQLYALVDLVEEDNLLSTLRFPSFVNCKEHRHRPPLLWYSAGGTSSVLHHDDADNILLVLSGKKDVILAHQDDWANMYAHEAPHPGSSPIKQDAVDLDLYPDFANVRLHKGTLEEGDALLIPHSYWHQVVSSVGSSSGPFARRNVALNFWWAHRDDWLWWNPAEQDVFDHLGNLKNYDASRKGNKFKCSPRTVATFDNIRLVDYEDFKERLSRKRIPFVKDRYKYSAYPDLHQGFCPPLWIDDFL